MNSIFKNAVLLASAAVIAAACAKDSGGGKHDDSKDPLVVNGVTYNGIQKNGDCTKETGDTWSDIVDTSASAMNSNSSSELHTLSQKVHDSCVHFQDLVGTSSCKATDDLKGLTLSYDKDISSICSDADLNIKEIENPSSGPSVSEGGSVLLESDKVVFTVQNADAINAIRSSDKGSDAQMAIYQGKVENLKNLISSPGVNCFIGKTDYIFKNNDQLIFKVIDSNEGIIGLGTTSAIVINCFDITNISADHTWTLQMLQEVFGQTALFSPAPQTKK